MRVRVIPGPAPSDIAKDLLNLPFSFSIPATLLSPVIPLARDTANQQHLDLDSIR
jgi:hypothetical protein